MWSQRKCDECLSDRWENTQRYRWREVSEVSDDWSWFLSMRVALMRYIKLWRQSWNHSNSFIYHIFSLKNETKSTSECYHRWYKHSKDLFLCARSTHHLESIEETHCHTTIHYTIACPKPQNMNIWAHLCNTAVSLKSMADSPGFHPCWLSGRWRRPG